MTASLPAVRERDGLGDLAGGELGLSLAGHGFLLRADDRRWLDVLAPRYAPFAATAAGPVCEVELRATGEPPPDWQALAPLLEPPTRTTTENALALVAAGYRVALDAGGRWGRAEGPLHRAPVDQLLRHALPLRLAADGLLLHGALLADERGAFVCCGPSGCGKSTLARLLPARAHCDELAAVRRHEDGWGGWSLPYWHGRPAALPLRGLHLLRHGADHARVRLRPEDALRRLAREVLWPAFPAAAERAFAALATLVAELPVWELSFRPQPDVWEVLAGADEGAA